MFFYDTDWDLLCKHLECLCTPEAYQFKFVFLQPVWAHRTVEASCAIPFLALSLATIACEWYAQRKQGSPYNLLLHPIACGVEVFLIIILQHGMTNQFIYAAF